MMLHRLRAHLSFPEGSGLPAWCQQQMAVRHGQAVHIRQGDANAEPPLNAVEDGTFWCDLPLQDEAAAADALTTLSDQNVLGLTVPRFGRPSWVEHHLCGHDEDPQVACALIDRREGPGEDDGPPPPGEGDPYNPEHDPQPWVAWDGNNDHLYQVGRRVIHNGSVWESTTSNNHWEPGVFGWVVV